MSEQGWREFLAAGLEDWVVLHGGPMAAYAVESLAQGGTLAGALAEVPGLESSGAFITLGATTVTVRLTRGVFRLEAEHIETARAVSAVARHHGARADRSRCQGMQLAIAAHPDERDPDFWRAVLGYAAIAQDNGADPLGHGSTFWTQDLDPAKPLRHAMHVDVSVAREHAAERLSAALAAGGRIVDDSDAPEWWVLADRAGNKVCIASWPDGAEAPAGA